MRYKMVEITFNTSFFVEFLQLIFITLKLTGHIGWSWAWVLSPVIIIITLIFIVEFTKALTRELRRNKV